MDTNSIDREDTDSSLSTPITSNSNDGQSVDSYWLEHKSSNDLTNTSSNKSRNKHKSGASLDSNSIVSTASKGPSIAITKTITNAINGIWDAVQDDNEQTEMEKSKDSLNHLLESRFDVGDAFQMNENTTDDTDMKKKNPKESDLSSNFTVSTNNNNNNNNSSSSKVENAHDLTDSDRSSVESIHIENTNRIYDIENTNNTMPRDTQRNDETLEKVFTNKSTGVVELPPDKGYAWVVVISVFLIMFNTWGCNSAFGVYLSYYLSNDVFPHATKYDYALIAGLTVALGQGGCPLAMYVMRIIGLRPTMLIGCVLMVAAFLCASFATRLWELYMTQGVMIGFSIALIFAPATTVLPGWFLKKRAVSMGISLMGTGAGGVTFGLASQKMISDRGNTGWCYRMLAITCTVSCLIAIALIRERKPLKPVGFKVPKMKEELQKLFNWNVIRQPVVPLVAVWFTLALLGYNLMIFTLASYAVARGMSQHQGSSLTAILNGAQAIGRPIMGLMGDRIGRANITIILTSVLTVYMFVFWITAHTYVQLIIFSIMVGSCVGVANVMNTVLIADLVQPNEFLAAWAFVNYAGAPVLLCCEVIAQALVKKELKNPYLHTQLFAGCCFICALFMILVLREVAVKKKLTTRQEENNRKLSEYDGLSDKGFDLEHKETSTDIDGGNEAASMDKQLEKMHKRKAKYDILLGSGVKKYFMRMTYPMKV